MERGIKQIDLRQNNDQHDHCQGSEQDDPLSGADALCVHAIENLLGVRMPVNFIACKRASSCVGRSGKSNWNCAAYFG